MVKKSCNCGKIAYELLYAYENKKKYEDGVEVYIKHTNEGFQGICKVKGIRKSKKLFRELFKFVEHIECIQYMRRKKKNEKTFKPFVSVVIKDESEEEYREIERFIIKLNEKQ